MFKTRLFILIIIAAVALSACATLPQTLSPTQPATATPPRATPAQPGAPVTTLPPIITPLPADGDVMPRFILAARQALAARLSSRSTAAQFRETSSLRRLMGQTEREVIFACD